MPCLTLGQVFSRFGWGLLPKQCGSQALRPAPRTTGEVVCQQGRLHLRAAHAACFSQVVMQQVHQFFLRELMRLASCLPQPVAEIQKVMKRRAAPEQQL